MRNYDGRNLSMMTDLYQLTMMQSYFNEGNESEVVFDLFYRTNPFGGAYAVACGIDDAIEYIKNLHFDESNIDYLRSLGKFNEGFLQYLKDFKFTGTVWAVQNGTVVFPMEPIIQVKASIMQAQLVETTILNLVNHQTLIATKASRVRWSCKDDTLMEFGLRRAQGPDAGIYGAKAAVIAGADSTSNVLTGEMCGTPLSGTHAHSYIMSHKDELTAFRNYAKDFPNSAILLCDTYDTLKSGVPNAITVFKEMQEAGTLPEKGKGIYGIRLDSGDLAWLSIKAREMLDGAGFKDAIISASSDLDEYLVESLKAQGATITCWGVGTNLITAKDCPALGGVYKLAAVEEGGALVPRIKLSENVAKVTNPGEKRVLRIVDKKTGLIRVDLICMSDENYNADEDLTVFHPVDTWKKKTIRGGTYDILPLHVLYLCEGEEVLKQSSLAESKEYCRKSLGMLSADSRRLLNPHIVHVDLSEKLWSLKDKMIKDIRESMTE